MLKRQSKMTSEQVIFVLILEGRPIYLAEKRENNTISPSRIACPKSQKQRRMCLKNLSLNVERARGKGERSGKR